MVIAESTAERRSIPVSDWTTALAWATVLVAVRTTSDAPSVDRTVSDSMPEMGSAAARTMSGSRSRIAETMAASLNWR